MLERASKFIDGRCHHAGIRCALAERERKKISHTEAQYQVERFWMGALQRAVQEGDVEFGSLMAGQSVGLVEKIRPLREALFCLVEEAEAELRRLEERLFPKDDE